jgi:hypothetical protein
MKQYPFITNGHLLRHRAYSFDFTPASSIDMAATVMQWLYALPPEEIIVVRDEETAEASHWDQFLQPMVAAGSPPPGL